MWGMITEKTVFVLGAGASKPYGFPLGQELADEMIRLLNPNPTDNQPRVTAVVRAADCKVSDLVSFLNDLRDSQVESVDAFLEHRPDLVPVGKHAIAAMLLFAECQHGLRDCKREQNWYQYLLKMLNPSFDAFHENQLSIITYNYDRSLEEFLFKALRVREVGSHSPEDWAARLKECLPIVHLHGQLGGYEPFVGRAANAHVPYGEWRDGGFVAKAGDAIRVIHESFDLDADPVFQKAYKMISEAKHLFFIGFGYDPINLKRLRLGQHMPPTCSLDGTAFGLTLEEKNHKLQFFGMKLALDALADPSLDALAFIRGNPQMQKLYK